MATINVDVSYASAVAHAMASAARDVGIPDVCRSAGATDVAVQAACVEVYGRLASVANDSQSLFERFARYVENSAEEFKSLDETQMGMWSV